MTFRIFSKLHNLYTDSPNWPSNQRSSSEWFLAPNGEIVEAIDFNGLEFMFEHHDPRNFDVEPWTGYFDSRGKKIYRGDILEMFSMFDFISEVTWKDGAFWLKAIDKNGYDQQFTPYLASHWTTKGNIHNVEYAD